jgi:Uma2 family endonuclease
LQVVPDFVVEVVSPTDSFTRINEKVVKYLNHGVKLVVVADPRRRVVHVHTPQQPDGRVLRDTDTLDGGDVLPGWSLAITALFDTSPEDWLSI